MKTSFARLLVHHPRSGHRYRTTHILISSEVGHSTWKHASLEQPLDRAFIFVIHPGTDQRNVEARLGKTKSSTSSIDMVKLFERTRAMLSSVRTMMTDELDEEFKEGIMSELVRTDLTPDSVRELLLSKPATTP